MKINMKKQIFLVCLWMVWSAAILSAQEPPQAPSENLSLQDAIALAEQKHPGLLELEAQSQAAWARVKEASAWDNPELLLKTEGNTFSSETGDYMVGLGQSIPIGGRISKAREAAEREADLSVRAKNLRLLEILGKIRASYATAAFQQEAFKVRDALRQEALELHRIAEARRELGQASADEVAAAALLKLEAQAEAERAESLYRDALSDLRVALGLQGGQVLSLADSLENSLSLAELDSIAELPSGDSEHPALSEAEAQSAWRESLLALAKAKRIPDINVEILYRRMESERKDGVDLGIGIPLPIFSSGRAQVEAARSDLEAARQRERLTALELDRRRENAYRSLKLALSNEQRWKKEILPALGTILQTRENLYAAGDISLETLLKARSAAAEYRLARLESLRELLIAFSEYKTAGGN